MFEWLSPLRLFNALTPRPGGVERSRQGLAYGALARQRLDVFRPRRLRAPAPLLVFLHGGGWETGDREGYGFAGRAFASQGFVTVVPSYRLTGDAPYPAFLEDCARAVAWSTEHAVEWGAEPGRVLLCGHSAGAYNAAMLALDRRWLARAGAPDMVAGWAGLAGPYDFLPLEPGAGLRTFGDVPDKPSTQPINYATAQAPPTFLAHGGRDVTVKPGNSHRLASRLEALGVPVELRDYPDAGHADLATALVWPFSRRTPVLADCAGFLHRAARNEALEPAPRDC